MNWRNFKDELPKPTNNIQCKILMCGVGWPQWRRGLYYVTDEPLRNRLAWYSEAKDRYFEMPNSIKTPTHWMYSPKPPKSVDFYISFDEVLSQLPKGKELILFFAGRELRSSIISTDALNYLLSNSEFIQEGYKTSNNHPEYKNDKHNLAFVLAGILKIIQENVLEDKEQDWHTWLVGHLYGIGADIKSTINNNILIAEFTISGSNETLCISFNKDYEVLNFSKNKI